jgi:hypothetical protein
MSKNNDHLSWSYWDTLCIEIDKRLKAQPTASSEERVKIISDAYAEYGASEERWNEYWQTHLKNEEVRTKKQKNFYDRTHFTYLQLRSPNHDHSQDVPSTPFLKRRYLRKRYGVFSSPAPYPPPVQEEIEEEADICVTTTRFIQQPLFDLDEEAKATRHDPSKMAIIGQMEFGKKAFDLTDSVVLDEVIHAHRLFGEDKNKKIGRVVTKIRKDARDEARKKKKKAKNFKHTKKGRIQAFGESHASWARQQREERNEQVKS